MSTTTLLVLSFVGLTDSAEAGGKYDKKIERAAIAIVSAKLGGIRGAHSVDEPHALYPPFDARTVEQGTLEPTPFERPVPKVNGFKAILTAFE